MSKELLQAPRGTRDFYPEDLRLRNWLFEHFRATAALFGFEEIDAPVLEHAELFIRKAGEEIVDQLYHFTLHDRHLALRPEITPQIARMVAARRGALRMPLRWFSIPQCWRYERMSRGRRREHYQWNMDIWGEPGVAAEAELIASVFHLLDRLGLERGDVMIRINSRSLLEETLRETVLAKRPEVFPALCIAIDKLDKIGEDAVIELLSDPKGLVGLPIEDARFVLSFLKLRDIAEAKKIARADSPALAEIARLFELIDAYGHADRVAFDASIVRGLAYYTGIVFEAFDSGRELRAVCGGGRYDHLLETLGGPATPAVGFGFGDSVIAELLAEKKRLPELSRELDAVVYAFTEAERAAAVRVARALRADDRSVELVLGEPRLKRVMADADRAGAREVYLLGPDEVARGEVLIRDLSSGEQRSEPIPE
ncbi:MAG: histidine--tRNA ligase [Deltaproteobacteria bacterium]|nr:histidine--tRNA ligase [Deltaproteobacteria bacterium]